MEAPAAVIVIDCRLAAVTVRAIVFEVTPLIVALMLLDPADIPVPNPALLMAKAAGFDELHVAEFVRF